MSSNRSVFQLVQYVMVMALVLMQSVDSRPVAYASMTSDQYGSILSETQLCSVRP